MAWIVYFVVGITVVTATTEYSYKCPHSGYMSSDSEPRSGYQYGNKEPINIPAPSSYKNINSQSAILSWQALPESRRGLSNYINTIVFHGPTSETSIMDIPEHCRKIGVCEDVPNYPQELANKIIAELADTSMFENEKLDLVPDEKHLELCSFQEKIMYPKAAVDPNGKWHTVLNDGNNPIQGVKVQTCVDDRSPCSEIVTIQPGYKARCKQKYMYRKMAVIHNGARLVKLLQLPSCCSCVARLDIDY